MKILYISNAIFPSESSRSLSIIRVCQALSDIGLKVKLSAVSVTKKHDNLVSFYGIKGGFDINLNYFAKAIYNELSCWFLIGGFFHAFCLLKIIRGFQPDFIYSRLTISELIFIPKDIPLIFEMHSLGPLGQVWWRRALFKFIFKRKNIRRIIVTTNVLQDWLKLELPNIEVVVARLSAEQPIVIEQKLLTKFKSTELLGHYEKNVGYTGFMDTYGLRGTDVICKVASNFPNVGFHLVGGEPAVVEHWKSFAEKYNSHKNIFFYGRRDPSEMPFFLNFFDIVLAPLQFRPNGRAPLGQNMSPLKIPQYMAYKKAIIASKLNAHEEVLNDGKDAILVPHDSIDAWSHAIAKLLNNEKLRSHLGKNAFARYNEEFTPSKRMSKILDGLYDK